MLIEKIFDLLISLYDLMDTFLNTLASTIMWGSVTGNDVGIGAVNTMSYLTMLVLFCLTVAFLWNLGEVVVHRAKHLGERGPAAMPWTNIKNIIFIVIVFGTCVRANSIFTNNPMGGSYLGVSYTGVTQGLERKNMTGALQVLAAVDVVSNWVSCLNDFSQDRDQKMLEYIAAKDPGTYQTYMRALQINGNPGISPTMVERLEFAWEGIKELLTTSMAEKVALVAQVGCNLCLYGLTMLVVLLCSLLFVYHAGRTIILLAFYIKLAALLSMIVLPAAIGILYFERLRHAGIAIIKQIIVIMLVSGIMAGAVKTVFSNQNIKTALTVVMQNELNAYANKITDYDFQTFKLKTFVGLEQRLLADSAPSPQLAAAMTMSPNEAWASCLAVIKIMFILGTMLIVIGKLFDIVNGVLGEMWDPLQEGAKAA